MKVLITVKISDEQLEKIKSLGYEIIRISESKIKNCEEVDELKEILNAYSPYYSKWRDYINNIMLSRGLSYEKLGKKCGFSKNTIKSWIKNNKVPKDEIYKKFI